MPRYVHNRHRARERLLSFVLVLIMWRCAQVVFRALTSDDAIDAPLVVVVEDEEDPPRVRGGEDTAPADAIDETSGGGDDDDYRVAVFYHVHVSSREEVPRVVADAEKRLSFLRPDLRGEVFVRSFGPGPAVVVPGAVPIAHDDDDEAVRDPDEARRLTLRALWRYCRARPRRRVAFWRSDAPESAVRAAASDACAARSDVLVCDACSGRFAPSPRPRAVGDAWIAECRHVADRLSDPLLVPLRTRGTTPSSRRGRDDDPSPSERWLYSHPHTRPCDVLPLSTDNENNNENDNKNESEEMRWDLRRAPRFRAADDPCRDCAVNLRDLIVEYYQSYCWKQGGSSHKDCVAPSRETWWGWSYFSSDDEEKKKKEEETDVAIV